MVFEQELDLLIRSSYPIIYVPTPEEERAEQLIAYVAEHGTPARMLHFWDFVNGFESGLAKTPGNPWSPPEQNCRCE